MASAIRHHTPGGHGWPSSHSTGFDACVKSASSSVILAACASFTRA